MSQTRYRLLAKVDRVSQLSRNLAAVQDDDGKWTVPTEPIGWFVLLAGSHEALYLGQDEPSLKRGDTVAVTIEPLR